MWVPKPRRPMTNARILPSFPREFCSEIGLSFSLFAINIALSVFYIDNGKIVASEAE